MSAPVAAMPPFSTKSTSELIPKPRALLKLDPARRRQDAIQNLIVWLDRHLAHYLLIERDAAGLASHSCQKLVIKPFAPAQPAAGKIECYPRHQNQVQLIQGLDGAAGRGFPNSKRTRFQVPCWI